MPTPSRRGFVSLVLHSCCGAMLAVAGCSDIEVTSSYAPSESLTAVPTTYDWAPATRDQSDFWSQRAEMRDLVHKAIEERFTERGYTKQAGSQTGFYVRLNATKENRTDSGVNPHGEVYEKIALIMDVVRPTTGRTIWRGAATARLDSSANPEQRRTRIHEAAHKLVDRFADGNK